MDLFVSNNKYLLHAVDNIIFGMSVLDYPSRTADNHVSGTILKLA